MSPARPRALVVAAVLVLAAVLPIAGAGRPAGAATGDVRLLSQSAWVTPGSDFVLRLGVTTDAPADVELSVAVHQAVQNRTQFRRTIDDRVSGSPIRATSAPLGELERDPGGAVRVVFPVDGPGSGGQQRLILRRPGVYPVRAELRELGGGKVVDRLTTHLVYVPPSIDGPQLGVSFVLPIHAAPARQPDGTRDLPPATVDAIAAVARAVQAGPPGTPVLKPTPETLAALAPSGADLDGGEGTARDVGLLLRRAAEGRQVIPGTYVPINPASFDGALESEAAAQRAYGTAVIRRLLAPDPSTNVAVLDGMVDDDTIDRLRDEQIERVVLPEAALTPIPLTITLAQPFELRGRQGRQMEAASADAGLAEHAARGRNGVLGAHHLLADLAVLYFDSPGLVRGVVAALPRTVVPDPQFVETVLSGLGSSPVLRAIDLDTLFDDVPAATSGRRQPLVRELSTGSSASPLPVDRLTEARARLGAFTSVPQPGSPIVAELEERLLVAQSADLDRRRRDAHLDAFDEAIDAQLDAIHIPRSRSITLTAREGDVPVTIRSDLDYPARVVIQLTSDKLEFPGGPRLELDLDRRNTTRRFQVRARTSGSFPLKIEVVSPRGGMTVAESRFTVRSTAASGVGIGISVGALLFLVLWWFRHGVRNRRARRAEPARG